MSKAFEFHTYQIPPLMVKTIYTAFLEVLGKHTETWQDVKISMGHGAVEEACKLDVAQLSRARLFKLKKEIEGLTVEESRKASLSATIILEWLLAILQLHTTPSPED